MEETKKPRFTHDCDECKLFASDESGDWYVCCAHDDRSVIHRHSDDPPNYASAPVNVGRTNVLIGALLRGFVLTESEARQLLALAWMHENDLPFWAYQAAPSTCNEVSRDLRWAVLRTK